MWYGEELYLLRNNSERSNSILTSFRDREKFNRLWLFSGYRRATDYHFIRETVLLIDLLHEMLLPLERTRMSA